jgi:hypothetical protein
LRIRTVTMDELVTAAGRQSERLIAIRQDDQIIL